MQKLIKQVAAISAMTFSVNVSAAVVTADYTATVQTGAYAGTMGTGVISYDDALLNGVGVETLSGSSFQITLNVFGQTFTSADDLAYPWFPELSFIDGTMATVDFAVSEHYVADTDPAFTNLVDITEPGVVDISIWGDLTAVAGGGYTAEMFINESSVVPVPAAVWLFGSGLLGLVGVARRRA